MNTARRRKLFVGDRGREMILRLSFDTHYALDDFRDSHIWHSRGA